MRSELINFLPIPLTDKVVLRAIIEQADIRGEKESERIIKEIDLNVSFEDSKLTFESAFKAVMRLHNNHLLDITTEYNILNVKSILLLIKSSMEERGYDHHSSEAFPNYQEIIEQIALIETGSRQ